MTSDAQRVVLGGGDAAGRASALAGALAECGVEAVAVVEPGGGWREARARETDLPGEIARLVALGGGEVLGTTRNLRVVVSAGSLECVTTDAEIAHALRRAGGR